MSWILWHPQQGLWNENLLRVLKSIIHLKLLFNIVRALIIFSDTIILMMRVFKRRLAKLGILKTLFFKISIPKNVSILYFDLGLHIEAKELTLMINRILPRLVKNYRVYGFEASLEFIKYTRMRFSNSKKVTIINKALCYKIPVDGKVKLFKESGMGSGSSIYRTDYQKFELVDAMRFTDWLAENNIKLENYITLLRMNIEGAEYEVIKDLVNNGFDRYIDGYYGMWDDVSKIGIKQARDFQDNLTNNNISPITFNNRDFLFPLRLKLIEYDIRTCVHNALNRF